MEKPEMFRVMEELEAMPELQRIQRIQLQQSSYFIFQKNADELRKVLKFHSDVKENLALWDVHNRDSLSFLQLEIGRLLHNFTASAFSLVETTRRLKGKCVSTNSQEHKDFAREYQDKIDTEFKDDPLSQFIQCLRNYTVHYEIAPVVSELNFSMNEQNQNLESRIVLHTVTLRKFEDWKPSAKDYIASCGDKIVLDSAIEKYFEKVSQFYNWFYERLNEVHREDIDRIAAKQEELKRAYIPHPADLMGWED